MGDGPFKEPEAPKDTKPAGRARYGGLAPLVQNMGDKNKTRDPYFTPPKEQVPPPDRGKVEPPLAGPPGGKKDPVVLQPDDADKKFQPKKPAKWDDPQPGLKLAQKDGDPQKSKAESQLERLMGSKASKFSLAREKQTGSNIAKATVAGTITGLATEPLVKLGDKGASKLMQAGEGTKRYAVGEWYQRNYTKVGSTAFELANENSLVAKSAANWERTFNLDAGILKKLEALKGGTPLSLTAEELKHIETLRKALGIKEADALANGTIEALLKERQALFQPVTEKLAGGGTVLRPTIPLTQAGTEKMLATIRGAEAVKGTKLLTAAEKGYLETQQLAYGRIKTLSDARLAEVEAGGTKWLTAKGSWENAKRGFLYTLGTGGVLEIDHNVRDRMYGKDAKSWETSSLTVPLAIGLGKGFKGKGGLAAVAVIGGHLVDKELPVPDWMPIPESMKTFSMYDAVPLALAFSVPSKSKWVKAGTIASAVVLGKGLDAAFLSGAGDVEQTALQSAGADKRERTFDSMERSVRDWKALGNKNEPLLEQNLAGLLIDSQKNWKTMSQEEKLNSHRATIAVARALGEHHLDHGTRLSAKAVDSPMYVLDGLNLDMGGDALTYLQMARKSVDGAKAMTEIMAKDGKSANGKAVSREELNDLDSEKTKIDASIETIYGKHDIDAAFRKLKKFIDVGETANGATFQKELAYQKTFVDEMNAKIARNWANMKNPDGSDNPEAQKFVAKLLRDQALAKMAFAGNKLDHGDDIIGAGRTIWGTEEGRKEGLPGMTKPDGTPIPKGYDGVIDLLRIADQLDPDNKDLPELKALCNRLQEEVLKKEPGQWEKFDILNVRGK